MKKIISKLALVGVAVAALCTSCVVEDIQTTFDLAEAVCTVNVKALYGPTGEDITNQVTYSHKYGSAATFTIPTSNKTVMAEALTITASFKTLPAKTETVNIGTLLPGGSAAYSVLFVFGSEGDIRIDYKKESTEKTIIGYLDNAHYAHDGDHWFLNDTEFILNGAVDESYFFGGVVTAYDPADEAEVLKLKKTLEDGAPVTKIDEHFPFTVSAWAAYRVIHEKTIETQTWTVLEINDIMNTTKELGTVVFDLYSMEAMKYEEKANPKHAAHYVHGEGHDGHGAYDNAGGGIVYGE